MEKVNAKFLSDMSHELRTPLSVIVGMCDIAMHHIDDMVKVEDCLAKISNASDYLTGLLNNLLDIGCMEQGVMVKEELFSIYDMMEDLRLIIEPMAEDRHQICTVSAEALINDDVISSQRCILQVLVNLASNAVKYTPDGGVVKITADKIEEDSGADDMATYRFICQDSGIGMSREFAEHIFEPFARADDVRSASIAGTGLGMSIVKKIVDMMGGNVSVNSVEGLGTTVCVFLRLRKAS